MSERGHRTLVHLLRWRSDSDPTKIAYRFLEEGESEGPGLTYHETDHKARCIGARLQELGIGGERALLMYGPGLDFVTAFFGCVYAGVVAVPTQIPANRTRLNQSLLRFLAIIDDARPKAILTTSATMSKFRLLATDVESLKDVHWVATDAISPELADEWALPSTKGDALAFLQYTSGSTASPKGVMVSHANILANSEYIDHGFEHTPESLSLTWLPHFHDMGLINGVIQPLYKGFSCMLMPPTAFLQSPSRWLRAISNHRVTHSGGPNFAYELCIRKIDPKQEDSLDLSSWVVAFSGAEPVRKDTLDRFATTFAPFGFQRTAFYPAYGLAEATLKVTGGRQLSVPIFCSLDSSWLERNRIVETAGTGQHVRTLVGCGGVACATSVVIVNPESRTRCGTNEVGEIWVSGSGVAQGYWNRPQETEKVFGARLADTGEGPFLRTGDLGFLRAGELFVAGRIKDLIIIRGLNHYPQDIELTVERSHPALRPGGCAAFSIDVSSEERVVVVQEVDPKRRADAREIIGRVRRVVAENHEIQLHAVVLTGPGGVPKTTSGKVQRSFCRSLFLEDKLEVVAQWLSAQAGIEEESTDHEDGDALERWLCRRLSAKIGVPAEQIDPREPASHYGIDSLMAIELAHSVQTHFGVLISVSDLLQAPSVAELAEIISGRRAASLSQNRGYAESGSGEGGFPLSRGQQALWFLNQIAPESSAYNIAAAVRIVGEVDVDALREAVAQLLQRHETLRTTFTTLRGAPSQRVHRSGTVLLEVEDASGWNEGKIVVELTERAYRPFDLGQGPLTRVSLLRRSIAEHLFVVVVHHIVADMWSIEVVLDELARIYSATREGRPFELPPLQVRYSDYVRWETEMLESVEGEALWSYWRKQLDGAPTMLNLPLDRARPKVQTFGGAGVSFAIEPDVADGLKRISRDGNATLYMTLLTAFEVLLYRYAGQTDFLIGAPTAGRNRAETAGMVGYFVNPVVLRADMSGERSFAELLARVRLTVIDAFAHDSYPFPLLVERLHPDRDPTRSPLFQVMFVLQRPHRLSADAAAPFVMGEAGGRLRLGEWEMESLSLDHRIAQFDLTLTVIDVGAGLRGSFDYNTDLFDRATIERMAGQFQTLLESVVPGPEEQVSRLNMLPWVEREQILLKWNDTSVNYGESEILHEIFEGQVERAPDDTALVYEARSMTYRELNDRANRLAHLLQSVGVGPDMLVGISMERSIEMVVGLLGILKAGGAYVPIDPQYPRERLEFMIRDASVAVLLTQEHLVGSLPKTEARVICLDTVSSVLESQIPENPRVRLNGDNLAYAIYTSGSTGTPKGAMNTHSGITNRLLWMQDAYRLTSADRVLQKTPFSFDVSVWEFFWPLITGARLVVTRPGGHQDARYLAELIAEQEITTLHFVPSMLQVFLAELKAEPKAAYCRSVKRIICSGEALNADLESRCLTRLDAELHNLYGPTEAAVDVSYWKCIGGTERISAPIGRPIANMRLYVLDAGLQPVPIGVPGELYLSGIGLARGYHRRPDLTAAQFVPDPFSGDPGGRMYRTGDLARYLPNGEIEFLGRVDHQVKIRGFRVELGEIESVLDANSAVREAVVVATVSEAGDRRLVAYVVPAGEQVTQVLCNESLREYVLSRLPDFMVPTAFVLLESLPLLPNGKVDRQALPEPQQTRQLRQEYVTPRTEAEEVVARIFAEVLCVDRVGVEDNFFTLGGHSLLATQVLSRVIEKFDVELPLHRLFERPTVSAFAQAIAQSQALRSDGTSRISRVARPVEKLMARLDQLSDDEVERLLQNVNAEDGSSQ